MAIPKTTSVIQFIRQALSGEEFDYTSGSLRNAVFLLAIPMILELSLESIFAVVDIFFVSKLGENAIATVGLTESVITLIYSVAIGLSTAATAIVARRIGEKNPEDAARAGAQALIPAVIISFICSGIGLVFADKILELMGASADVVRNGTIFTRIMLVGNLPIVLLFLINGIFRGAGNAAIAMKSLLLASFANIVLCPILIHFYSLKGAAIATVIGRSIGVLYQCYCLFKGSGLIRIRPEQLRPDPSLIRSIVKIAWPATLQFIIASGSWIVLSRLVAQTGGTAASAGYQIAMRNVIFFLLPAWGLSNAAATLVGQNLGAGLPDRALKSVLLTARYNAFFMAFVMVLFVGFAEVIISFFTKDPDVTEYGAKALRIIGTGYIFYGIGMVMTQALNGAGDTRTPTLINFVGFWLFQVPLAYCLNLVLDWGVTGILIAIPVAETCIAVMAFYVFQRGKWKKNQV